MTQSNGPIVPTRQTEIAETIVMPGLSNMKPPGPQPNIVIHQHHYHQAPTPVERPSHYVPVPMQDSGLGEVARWGLGGLVALLCTWMMASAIMHQANAGYWANERQLQIIRNHPAGGQW